MRHFAKYMFVALVALMTVGVPVALACPATPSGTAAQARALNLDNNTGTDPFYYLGGKPAGTTNTGDPQLPGYAGFMNTDSNTFRFVNVNEQVFTMIGEGKHGLWRIQDNGTIREYLIEGKTGLAKGSDVNAAKNQAKVVSDYSSYIKGDGMNWSGWKSPQDPVNADGRMNFIDVPITNAKYKGKYTNHVPIDLPSWYCTMSGPTFPEAAAAMGFAFKQKGANKVGPLGKRAGLDVRELYTNVLRLDTFPDADSWVNVGTAKSPNWQAIDDTKTRAEYYLVERPFFNVKYLFVMGVYNNVENRDFEYVRPDGAYYDSLVARGYTNLKTTVTMNPEFAIEADDGALHAVTGTKFFGVKHPNRPGDNGKSGGGACPMRGGDWDDYPATTGGSGWPTQYEEITPLCDGVLVDIKFFANLDGATWDDAGKYLPNANGSKTVTYKVKPGFYGKFVDPYHTDRGVENPQAQYIYTGTVLTFQSVRPPVGFRK